MDTGMPQVVDVSAIPDPDVRRALRAVVQVNQHLSAQIQQQQQEIEALLQMLIEKHVGSLGEFKRHMIKLQNNDARSERLHGAVAGTAAPSAPAAATAATVRSSPHSPRVNADADDRPRRYTL
jgi:hypothetical protein